MLTDGKYDDLSAISAAETRRRRGRRHRALAYMFALFSIACLSSYAFVERDRVFLFVCTVFALLAFLHSFLSKTSEPS